MSVDPLFLETVDDVGGDAGIDSGFDCGGIALVDEHCDRPLYGAADLEHLGKHVATWIFEIDQDDVGIKAVDARKKVGRFVDPRDVDIASLAQTVDEDRGTNRIFVDDDDLERGVSEEQCVGLSGGETALLLQEPFPRGTALSHWLAVCFRRDYCRAISASGECLSMSSTI